jgi:hypothetical protein
MIRAAWRSLKQGGTVLALLSLTYAVAEITLRLQAAHEDSLTPGRRYDRGLYCRSWTCWMQVKPGLRVVLTGPDGGSPHRFRSDSFGMRGPERAIPKPPGLFRILCLGDERLLAAELLETETFCARLEASLSRRSPRTVEVCNAGLPDGCPLLAAVHLRQRLLALQPDLVMFFFDPSDVADDFRMRRHFRLDPERRPLGATHPELVPPVRAEASGGELLLAPRWARQSLARWWTGTRQEPAAPGIADPQGAYLWLQERPPDWSTYIQQTLAPIDDLHMLADGVRARFLVVLLPAPWQLSADAGRAIRPRWGVPPDAVYPTTAQEEVARLLQERGHRVLNAAPTMAAAAAQRPLSLDGALGFSSDGHALLARMVEAYLAEHLRSLFE